MLLSLPVVVVLSTHFGILCDALLPGLSADQGPPHGARYDAAQGHENGGRQNEVRSPSKMGNEEQHIDEECQKTSEESKDAHDEEKEQIADRVRGRVEMGDNRHDKHDEGEECSDRVDN